MKLRTSFLTRSLALVMALVMIASSANLGLFARVFAAETGKTITDGELVANNYALSDAEKALLNSGLLAEGKTEYNKPTDEDNLIAVDPVAKTVKASSFENWKIASAWLETADGEKENITLDANGNGTITGDYDAYSVFVTYELAIDVDTAVQTTLLSTAGWLKQGVANIENVAKVSGSLNLLEQAMPALADLAKNGYSVNGKLTQFAPDVKSAISDLDGQMNANGGKLNLTVLINEFNQNKTKFVLTKGLVLRDEVSTSLQKFELILEPLALIAGMAGLLPGMFDDTQISNITMAADTLELLVNGLSTATDGDWTASEKGTALVKAGITDAEYAQLDALVAALGTISNVTVSGAALKADSATVKFGASMSDVALVAEIEYYENGVLKTKEWTDSVTLSDKDINEAKAKAEAEATVYAELTAWADGKLDLAQHFNRVDSYDAENLVYTIAYAPKLYTVTYSYQDAEELAYGVQITLPRHEDGSKAYDYEVNGAAYAQGSVVTVTGDTTITREEGKAYTRNQLLAVIVNNGYGNAKTNAILSSGALYGDETIAVRYPDANKGKLADFADGSDTVIATKTYAADYNGLSWAAYKYIVDGGSEKLFNGKSEANVGAFKTSVQVYFRLTLDNYGAATTQKWMDLAATLESEANAQKATLDALASSYDTMGQLDEIKLGALNGVIDVTDFTPGDGDKHDAETQRLRGEFKNIVSSIIKDHLDSDGKLKIYNMLGEYNKDGLVYYYTNYDAFYGELDKLSSYLNGLLEEEEALQIMVTAAGYPEYAEKITDVGDTLDTAKTNLSAPNPAIDLRDTVKVTALVNALTMDGTAGTAKAVAAPYLDDSAAHTVEAKGYKGITVTVKIKDQNGLSVSKSWTVEHELTKDDIAELKAEVNAKIAELLDKDAAYYTGNYDGSELDALVGTVAGDIKKVAYEYEWTLKTVQFQVPGMDAQTFDKNNATITLAASTDPNVRYDYYIDGVKIEGSTYTFNADQLAAIFAGNAPEITREEINLGAETFANFVKNLNKKIGRDDAAVYKNGTLNVNITTAELTGFVMGLVMDSGYSYIGLGGDGFVYLNEGGSLEISIQTLVNAIINENFSNKTIIDLVDGSGTLTKTTMDLGNDKAGATAYPFVLTLSGIPSQAAPVAEILNMGYININGTADHKLAVELNLPEKLYQAYLTALIATGEIDLDNVAAVNNTIAVQFLWDYANGIITNEEITTETYTNTLKKLGQSYDLTAYEGIYQKVRTAIQDYLVVANGQASINFVDTEETQLLKKVLDKVMAGSSMGDLLNMIKEYKGGLTFSADVTVAGIINNYEALIVDTGKSSVTDKFDYVKVGELAKTKISGTAIVILLKDATADLTFPGTALLDLNGFTLTGKVTGKGNLMIIDSDKDTFNGGKLDGTVSGSATIMGGTYTSDVTAFLKAGYAQAEGGAVHHNLFTVAEDAQGNVTYSINANFYRDILDGKIPAVKELAIDIAGDLVLNYFTTAYLQLEGEKVYGVALDDLIAIYSGNTTDELIVDLLNTVSAPGISNFINAVIADVLDFKTISENIGTAPIATYSMVTAPWAVEINHVKEGDYLTVGIGYGETRPEYNVNLAIVGENRIVAEVRELTTALAEIVKTTDIKINLDQPTYNNKEFNVSGNAHAVVEIDLTANENYVTVLAVILANGTGKTTYVEAINAGNMAALKKAIDKTTVADVIASLKALSRDVNFAAMAKKVGATVTADAAQLEAVYHIYLTVVGAVLDKLDVSFGAGYTLGSFDSDNDGIYVADKENPIIREGATALGGYNVKYNVSLTELSLSINLFSEVEPPVEEVAAIVVTDTEGAVVYEGASFLSAVAAVKEGYTVTINENVVADGGATVICSFNIVGADKLDMGTNYLVIGNTEYTITSDADTLNVASTVDGYRAAYVDGAYKLVEFAVVVDAPVAAAYYTKTVDEVRYLGVDLPIAGLTAAELVPGVKIADLAAANVTIEIQNYTDGNLVKTGDVLKANIVENGKVVAFITYTVVVIGDANGNGMIDVGDAVAMQTVFTNNVVGKETAGMTPAKLMAADSNMNGGIDVGDAVRVQTKWTLMTEASDKDAAWAEWIAKLS